MGGLEGRFMRGGGGAAAVVDEDCVAAGASAGGVRGWVWDCVGGSCGEAIDVKGGVWGLLRDEVEGRWRWLTRFYEFFIP